MKKRIQILIRMVLVAALLLSVRLSFPTTDTYQAATSYTNAKEFYESTAQKGQTYHAQMTNGTIYYATCAKRASSSSSLRYQTVGFDIQLSGNNHSVSFTVQRTGGSMTEIDSRQSATHEYILYAIDDQTLFQLATAANPEEAAYVLDTSVIDVSMHAILVTKQGNTLKGGITEDGSGGFTHWGTIYRLQNASDRSALKEIFTGHDFKSYYDIHEKLPNHELQIHYQVQGLYDESSTLATVGNSYTIKNGFLYQNNKPYIQKQRILQQATLLRQDQIQLQKTGYHIVSGAEWIAKDLRTFPDGTSYMPKILEPLLAEIDQSFTLYANWEPNRYTITYHANEGFGSILPTSMVYDVNNTLAVNTFTRPGYYLPDGQEWIDQNGNTYASGQEVSNLISEQNGTFLLMANWKPIEVSITTDKQGGSNGTDIFYEKYQVGFSLTSNFSQLIQAIQVPSKTGYQFQGYFKNIHGLGENLISADGSIQIENTYFQKDTTIYAAWEPETYTITFDKQGGSGGTDSITATYNRILPLIDMPVKTGFSFQGYFTEPNGQGDCYYGSISENSILYQKTTDLTLYAHWIDETPPTITLTADYDTWTNRVITLTAHGEDLGAGLASIQIYQGDTLVAEELEPNTLYEQDCVFVNNKEGIIHYKAIATDLNGQYAEAYLTVFSDITAPKGIIISENNNNTTFYITVTVTDAHVP